MLTMTFEQNGKPMYMQLYRKIREDIASRAIPPGSRLPSRRKLAAHLGISVSTVDNAYAQLLCEGYITSADRRGYFALDVGLPLPREQAAPAPAPRPAPAPLVDFSPSAVDMASFPMTPWRRLVRNASDAALLPCPHQGLFRLRAAICAYLYEERGVRCSPEQLLIGAGTDNLLFALGFLFNSSFTFVLENPAYNRAYAILSQMGHRVRSVDVDAQGMPAGPLAALERAAVYITPSHQFPLGITMPISRRMELLEWARSGAERYIIEDDYDSEFRYSSRPIPPILALDDCMSVLYTGTFTRAISPAIRVSYMALPQRLMPVYQARFAQFPSAASPLEQAVLAGFLENGDYGRHLSRLRKRYGDKRRILASALSAALPEAEIFGESAGHHILLRHPALEEAALCQRAEAAGVRVYPISPYFSGPVPSAYQRVVLLGYGGLSPEELRQGAALLAQAWG